MAPRPSGFMAVFRRTRARSTPWLIINPAGDTHVICLLPAESKLVHQNLLAVIVFENSRVGTKLKLIFTYPHKSVCFGAHLNLSITVPLDCITGRILQDAFEWSSIPNLTPLASGLPFLPLVPLPPLAPFLSRGLPFEEESPLSEFSV